MYISSLSLVLIHKYKNIPKQGEIVSKQEKQDWDGMDLQCHGDDIYYQVLRTIPIIDP